MHIDRANGPPPPRQTPKRDFAKVIVRAQVAKPMPMNLVLPKMSSSASTARLTRSRNETSAFLETRRQVVRGDEGLHERRENFDGKERDLPRDQKQSAPDEPRIPSIVTAQGQAGSGPSPIPRKSSPEGFRDSAAAVASLIDKIRAFHKSGVPTLQVSFTAGARSLARVQLQRTARGEVSVQLAPTGNSSRAQLSEHSRLLRQRLAETGLRVASLIIA
jgi:hypothetical protein